MATFRNGIMGGFRGVIGPVVGFKHQNADVMKSKSRKKKKKKNAGKPQAAQVLKVKLVSEFLALFNKIINVTYAHPKKKHTAYAIAQRYLLAHAVKGEMPEFEIDLAQVRLSKGSLETAWSAKASLQNSTSVQLTWEIPPTADIRKMESDELHIITYKPSTRICGHIHTGVTRKKLGHDFPIGTLLEDDSLHIWIYFSSPDAKSRSNSEYLGAVTLPENAA